MLATNHGKYIEWGATKKKDKDFFWTIPVIFQVIPTYSIPSQRIQDSSDFGDIKYNSIVQPKLRSSSLMASELEDKVGDMIVPLFKKGKEEISNHNISNKVSKLSKYSSCAYSETMNDEFYSLPPNGDNILVDQSNISSEEDSKSKRDSLAEWSGIFYDARYENITESKPCDKNEDENSDDELISNSKESYKEEAKTEGINSLNNNGKTK